jgi:hypothetical protein
VAGLAWAAAWTCAQAHCLRVERETCRPLCTLQDTNPAQQLWHGCGSPDSEMMTDRRGLMLRPFDMALEVRGPAVAAGGPPLLASSSSANCARICAACQSAGQQGSGGFGCKQIAESMRPMQAAHMCNSSASAGPTLSCILATGAYAGGTPLSAIASVCGWFAGVCEENCSECDPHHQATTRQKTTTAPACVASANSAWNPLASAATTQHSPTQQEACRRPAGHGSNVATARPS